MAGIAVTPVVQTVLLPISVADLQDDVTVGVNQDGQETRVTKLELLHVTHNLVHAQRATTL